MAHACNMARLKLKHSKKKRTVTGRHYVPGVRRKITHGGSVFLPDLEQQVKMIAMRGASDDEIADTFGVSREMFQKWRQAYPKFNDAVDKGRSVADANVMYALYRNAVGFHYEEDATTKDSVVRIERYAKPDTSAQQYWLNNRKPDEWGTKTSLTGGRKNGEDLPLGMKIESREEIIAAIVSLVHPKADGQSKPSHIEHKK